MRSLLLGLTACAPVEKPAAPAEVVGLTPGLYTIVPLEPVAQCTYDGAEMDVSEWTGDDLFPDEFDVATDGDTMAWTWEAETWPTPLTAPGLSDGSMSLTRSGAAFEGQHVQHDEEADEPGCVRDSSFAVSVAPVEAYEALVTVAGTMTTTQTCLSTELGVHACTLSGTWRLWPQIEFPY